MLDRRSIADYIGDLASKSATPGGGAAAALSGAQAAALISMVCELTRDAPEVISTLAGQARESADTFIELADRDMDSFNEVMAAYKQPRDKRDASLQPALREAADVPLAMIDASVALAPSIPALIRSGNPNLVTDVAIAALLLESTIHAARINVLINLASMQDAGYIADAKRRLEGAVDQARQFRAWHDEIALKFDQ